MRGPLRIASGRRLLWGLAPARIIRVMRRWFDSLVTSRIAAGDFTKWDFECNGDLVDFYDELGRRAIETYLAPVQAWGSGAGLKGFDAKLYARRLFDKSQLGTEAFKEFTGEVLAHWCSLSFTNHLSGREPIPHDNTPGFDSVSFSIDGSSAEVCLIQAKTTANHPKHHANYACAKFGELEKGLFQQELSRVLQEITRTIASVDERRMVMSALTLPENRTYRVVVVHLGMPNMPAMTRYSRHVTGLIGRRNSAFIHFPDWDQAWKRISETAYAYIS